MRRAELTRDLVPLWNDKRTIDLVRDFERDNAPETYLAESGNPPTPAWPGFKLAWLRDNDPDAYAVRPMSSCRRTTSICG
jgi:xylulokinase